MSKADADNVFSDAKTIALAHAALEGDSARVRRLVSEGANPNAQGKDNVALLEWALLRQSKPGMTTLLNAGANPSQPGLGGELSRAIARSWRRSQCAARRNASTTDRCSVDESAKRCI